jgi:pectate lyase C
MLLRLLGMITLLISTHCIAAPTPNTPEGYNAICNYSDTCMLTKANLVAFGSQGQYVYKVLSGSFACN